MKATHDGTEIKMNSKKDGKLAGTVLVVLLHFLILPSGDCQSTTKGQSFKPIIEANSSDGDHQLSTVEIQEKHPSTAGIWGEDPDPTIPAFDGCGLIKNCYSRYASKSKNEACISTRSCDMLVTFGKGLGEGITHEEAVVELYAEAHGWVALGFSEGDNLMGDDYVIECCKEGTKVNMYNSWNHVHHAGDIIRRNYTNRRLVNQSVTDNVRPIRLVSLEKKIYCKFYIKKKFSKMEPFTHAIRHFDLDKEFNYIFAFSNAFATYGPHGNLHNHIAHGATSEIGRDTIIAGQRVSPVPYQTRYLRYHGMLMVFCWLFFTSISIFFAKHLKNTWKLSRICKLEVWHFAHILTSVLGMMCILASVILQVGANRGWRNAYRSNFHTYTGIVCCCLVLVELATGLAIKTKDENDEAHQGAHHGRHDIAVIHIWVGRMVYIVAIFNIGFTDRVAYSFLSCNFKTYVFTWFGFFIFFNVVMTYYTCWVSVIMGRGYVAADTQGTIQLDDSPDGMRDSIQPTVDAEVDKDIELLEALDGKGTVPSGHAKKEDDDDDDAHSEVDSVSTVSTILSADDAEFTQRKSRKIINLGRNFIPDQNVVVEPPGRHFRVWSLGFFFIFTSINTFWVIRKLATYPRHCYSLKKLKELEQDGFN